MKNTVKEFRDLGLVFVEGDVCQDPEDSQEYSVDWFNSVNEGYRTYANDIVTELAWRDNTGEEPSFRGGVEVEFANGMRTKSKDADFRWSIKNVRSDVKKWRPVLSQPKETTEDPESDGSISQLVSSVNTGVIRERKSDKERFDMFACAAMQALLTNEGISFQDATNLSIRNADELIKGIDKYWQERESK